MTKLIYLIDSPGFGGSEIDFLARANYLVKDGDVIILSTGVDNNFLQSLKKTPVLILYKKAGNTWKNAAGSFFFFIKHFFKYRRSTFVFWAHHSDSNRWLQFYSALFKFKFIVVERLLPTSESDFEKSKLTLPLKRFIVSRSVKNVVCGYSQEAGYKKIFRTDNCITIPNSRNIYRVREEVSGYKISVDEFPLSNEFVIVTIGRLCNQKDQLNIIHAVDKLKSKLNLSLIIVGDGEKMEELKGTVASNGLKNVCFTGFDPEPLKWLSKANLFILNSLAEGLPGALIEAMAAGVPCIATDIPGNNELIINKKTGLLVPVKSPLDLAKAISFIMDHPDKSQQMATNAYEHVLKHYNKNVEYEMWKNVLLEVTQ